MTTLADDYLRRALLRIEVLPVYLAKGGYAEVIQECQEAAELLLKGVLRRSGIDPPRWHDVSKALNEYSTLLGEEFRAELPRVSRISVELRKEREICFYGEEDFFPSESYTAEQAANWIAELEWLSALVQREFNRG